MKKSARYFASEGLLIIFSILAALGVNEWRVRSSEAADTRKAVADLSIEMTDNLALLDGAADYHRNIAKKLSDAAAAASGSEEELNQTPFETFTGIEFLRESILMAELPQQVSWQVAKDRGVVARFDYSTAKTLSLTYDNQLTSAMELYFSISQKLSSPEMYELQGQSATLLSLSSLFAELAAREEALAHHLDGGIETLRENYPALIDSTIAEETLTPIR